MSRHWLSLFSDALSSIGAAERALAWQATKFGLVGFINVAVDFAVFLLALAFLTSSLVGANVLAWIVAVSCSYVLNSFITFAAESQRKLRWRAYAAFVASQIAGIIANTTTLVLAAMVMHVVLAKIAATVVAFAVNFTFARLFVFGRAQSQPKR